MTVSKEPATAFQYFERAKANLSPATWDYLMGGSETETTLNRNRRAIDCPGIPTARTPRRVRHRSLDHSLRACACGFR